LRAAAIEARCEKELRIKEEQLARAVAEANEARAAKSRFLSNVSNDLRVPLNTIVGFSELMLDRKIGAKSAERRECLSDILSSARELTGVVDRLLDLGKGEPVNQLLPGQGTVGLETLVQDVRYLLQALSTEGRGARIQVDLDPEVQYVTADREDLRQLVTSYLLYAGKMVANDGEVVVRTAAEGSSGYRLEVEYRGVPIAEKDNERLILDLESEAELAEAKQLVERHGGRAGVHTPPGRGTVLYAVLQPANEMGRRKAPAGPVLDSDTPDAEVLQGLAKVLGEISSADNKLGGRRCQEASLPGERNGRPRLKSLAGTGRKRLA
jgi:signal transduction histidine kinase